MINAITSISFVILVHPLKRFTQVLKPAFPENAKINPVNTPTFWYGIIDLWSIMAHQDKDPFMKIEKDMVVSIHYTLTDNDGNQLDSSQGQEPLVYLQGHQNIIPGLEDQLEGKTTGDKLTATIAPADAYGEVNAELVQEVPRNQFQDPDTLQVGMQFQVGTEAGPMLLAITALTDDTVTVDGNHPLAGVTLNFDVEVVEVRAASDEEIAHGHVHGPGGHHHD